MRVAIFAVSIGVGSEVSVRGTGRRECRLPPLSKFNIQRKHQMLKLESVKNNLKAEREGDWVDYPEWDGVSFKVRSIEAPEFTMGRDALLRRLSRKHKGDPIPPDDLTREVGTLYAKHILLDWKGLDQPHSADLALDILTDPSYRQVVKAVDDCAGRVGRGDADFIQAAAKN